MAPFRTQWMWFCYCEFVVVHQPALCFSDQWSPLNVEGKKQYDREFLLQLQFSSKSLEKPANLPTLPDVILDAVSDLTLFVSFFCLPVMIICFLWAFSL